MSAVRQFACEVCDAPRKDSGEWLLIPDETWGPALHILPWDDQLAAETGIYHLCCAHHAKELIYHWLSAGYLEGGREGIVWSFNRRASAVHDWQVTPRPERRNVERFPGCVEDTDPETLLDMMDLLDGMGDPLGVQEDALCEVFDA